MNHRVQKFTKDGRIPGRLGQRRAAARASSASLGACAWTRKAAFTWPTGRTTGCRSSPPMAEFLLEFKEYTPGAWAALRRPDRRCRGLGRRRVRGGLGQSPGEDLRTGRQVHLLPWWVTRRPRRPGCRTTLTPIPTWPKPAAAPTWRLSGGSTDPFRGPPGRRGPAVRGRSRPPPHTGVH